MSRPSHLSARAAHYCAAGCGGARENLQTRLNGADCPVLAICGPTSSGKSEIALRLAAALDGEIINADSRQIYAGMSIGTGQPDDAMRARAPHLGYGWLSPEQRYSAARFVEDADETIDAVRERGKLPLLVGGTGLYIEALAGTMPLDRLFAEEAVRERVRAEAEVHPLQTLHDWLSVLSPQSASRVPSGDRYRILRAIEAALTARSDVPPRSNSRPRQRRLQIVVLAVSPRELEMRVQRRVAGMFSAGLIGEAVSVRRRYGDAPALSGLGYAEALAVDAGTATQQEAVALTVRRTLRYAKRQRTWFRRMHDAIVVDASDVDAAAATALRAAREIKTAT